MVFRARQTRLEFALLWRRPLFHRGLGRNALVQSSQIDHSWLLLDFAGMNKRNTSKKKSFKAQRFPLKAGGKHNSGDWRTDRVHLKAQIESHWLAMVSSVCFKPSKV